MEKPRIAIVVGTVRKRRFGSTPARWMQGLLADRDDMDYEIVDLRDFPFPLFDEPALPSIEPSQNEVARRWSQVIAGFDGYIFIVAEYNHGISGALKNALDFAAGEFKHKAAAFVGYGGVGGARAIEQMRLLAVVLGLAPLKDAVHIGLVEFLALARRQKDFADFPHLEKSVVPLLNELSWWSRALKTAREANQTAD